MILTTRFDNDGNQRYTEACFVVVSFRPVEYVLKYFLITIVANFTPQLLRILFFYRSEIASYLDVSRPATSLVAIISENALSMCLTNRYVFNSLFVCI